MRRSWSLLAGSLVFVAPAFGCVFIQKPIEHGSHCAIQGSSACATCIRSHCQDKVDSCCGSESCAGDDGHSEVLDAVDVCGAADSASCASRLSPLVRTSPYSYASDENDVAACVLTTCASDCVSGQNVTVTTPWSCDSDRSSSTTCGSCIFDACGSTVDECCGDSSCSNDSSIQKQIGECIGGDAPACVYGVIQGDSGVAGKLRACIIKSCDKQCLGNERTHESCSLYESGQRCSCSDAEESDGPECSVTAVGGGQCVVGTTGCSCGTYGCSTSSDYECVCDFDHAASDGAGQNCSAEMFSSSSGSNDANCCLQRTSDGYSCTCREFSQSCNSSNERLVASCDLATVQSYMAVLDRCSN